MSDVDLSSVSNQVLWASFALAFVFGVLAQRTHFCTMGAVSDIVNIGDWTRMRMWVLAMGVAILGFNAMAGLGWVDASKSLYGASRLIWLSHLLGGLMFGFGMVLASGCGSKTLVRIGTGNLKSVVVFIVLGLAAFATLRGITAVVRVDTVDQVAVTLGSGQDLPSLFAHLAGGSDQAWAWGLGALLGLACIAWALARQEGRQPDTLIAGVGIGAVIVGVWYVSGVVGYLEENPNTLEEAFLATNSQRMESLSFVAPIAFTLDWLLFFSDKSKVLTLGIVTTVGVILGAAAHALRAGDFRWEGFRDAQDTAHHLIGGVLMGVGGVTALGCTIGQGLSGVSTLSLGSFLSLAGILGGAVLGLRYQIWQLERQA